MKNFIEELYSDRNNGREIVFKKKFRKQYEDICNMIFPNEFTFSQKIYHYINKDINLQLGICSCGNRCKYKNYKLGYYCHCSNMCSQNDLMTKYKRMSTNISKYGYDNPAKNNDIKLKQIKTNNDKYGYNSPSCIKDINIRQLEASYSTKKIRNTFNSSKAEKLFSEYLKKNHFKFQTQYRSDDYPFHCDFYMEDFDLYIEIQGSWTHGGDTSLKSHPHPYNSNDINDIIQYDLWKQKSMKSKYYANALETWTQRDVIKRNIAKEQNLNFIEIFSYDINTIVTEFEFYINNLKK